MAIKTTKLAWGIFGQLGVSPSLISQLSVAKIEPIIKAGILVFYGNGFIESYPHIKLSPMVVTHIEKATLGPASSNYIKEEIEKAIHDILIKEPLLGYKVADQSPIPIDPTEVFATTMKVDEAQALGILNILKKPIKPSTKLQMPIPSTKPVCEIYPSFYAQSIMDSSIQVTLAESATIYGKVLGTSSGSVYYNLARFNDLEPGVSSWVNIGMRYQSGKLSIRIEGPGVKEAHKKLAEVGIDFSSASPNHISTHVKTDKQGVTKMFGAIIATLGLDKLSEVGEAKAIC